LHLRPSASIRQHLRFKNPLISHRKKFKIKQTWVVGRQGFKPPDGLRGSALSLGDCICVHPRPSANICGSKLKAKIPHKNLKFRKKSLVFPPEKM
jgi:hypothetical protein